MVTSFHYLYRAQLSFEFKVEFQGIQELVFAPCSLRILNDGYFIGVAHCFAELKYFDA